MKKITIPVNVAVENRTYMRGKYTEKDIRPDDLEILLSGGHAITETDALLAEAAGLVFSAASEHLTSAGDNAEGQAALELGQDKTDGDNAEGQAALELGQDKTDPATGANKTGGKKKK